MEETQSPEGGGEEERERVGFIYGHNYIWGLVVQ